MHCNLEELVLYHGQIYHPTVFKFEDISMSFIKNCPKLRKILLFFDVKFQTKDSIELDEAGTKINDAVAIIIFFDDMMDDDEFVITVTNERTSFYPKFQL